MFYSEVSSLLLVSLSHIFWLPISASPERIQDPHHESTTSTWHCYKDEFAHASPSGHSLQAPCLRFIPTSPAKVIIADGTEVHPVRIQVATGMVSAASIQLRWTLIVSATQQGGRSESYPVQQCRNKISCDIHLPASVFSHGRPIVMVTGSYQRTPWVKTILNVSLQEQVPERLESQSDEWSEWSQCSHSCGRGTKTRHRACTGPDTSNCVSGVESHAVQCALQRCSEDWEGAAVEMTEESLPQWRDWSGWSVCSVSCGRGLNRRERTCLDQELSCTGQKTETRTCQLEDCSNDWNGAISERATTRRSDHGYHHHSHHTKRIKCHLDENRSQLPMELFWTSPSGEKITHAMTHEKNSKYHIEGTTLVVHEDKPTEGSYHCIVIYGGSSRSHNKEKAGPTGACLSHPCHHKGVCLDQPGPNNVSYRCLCPAGYEGMTCHMAPYLKGDVVVLSLLGWFVVSSTVIILIICFCCSKQMKKKKMKQRLELDDAPAEKLLAKILPHIDTTHKIESDTEEDIKPLLGFRPPQVAAMPPLKSTLSKEPVEMTRQPGKVRFKNLVKKVSKTPRKNVEGVGFPTLEQIKSLTMLTKEFKAQRNQNNSNMLDSNESDDNSLSSYTTLSSSCGSISEEDNGEECGQTVNHNMNNCSWDYSNVSSCAPFDLNSSSIVGNDDDSLLEISTEDFRDFQVASAFSVFRGSSSLNEKQAVIAPSLVHENSSVISACSPSLPSDRGTTWL